MTFVAKSDYFTGVGLKGWAQKRFFADGANSVPTSSPSISRTSTCARGDTGLS